MLTVYRRHRATCPNHHDRYARRDRCPCWAEGTVEGKYVRRTLKTRSWERAEELKREMESCLKQNVLEPIKTPTIDEAVAKFLADAEHGRKLTTGTLKKYRVLLNQLKSFAAGRAAVELRDIDVDFAREFRASWTDGAISSVKKLERLRAFCRFCVTAGWVPKNPAAAVAPPAIKTPPTLPLTEKEVAKALAHATDARWHALILVLRWTGLRIGDAMKLTEEKLDGRRLFLYTAKTGTPVHVPLPEFLVEELQTLPRYGGYFFWKRAGESKTDTAAGNARRALRKVFKDAGLNKAHPHQLRDSFAVGLLERGVPLETVSVLLGHANSRVTAKHYRPWVKSLQQSLEDAVAASWPTTKMVRVK
jgi:integrase